MKRGEIWRAGLPKEPVINVSPPLTLDRSIVSRRVGKLPARQLAALEDGLRLALAV